MAWLHALFTHAPEAALFLSLLIGYAAGGIKLGKFQLGGVGGSLLAAVALSQVGVHVDDGVKAVMFALFIYAVGFESGPQFFGSLNRTAIKEIVLAIFVAAAGLVTVLVLAKLFHLDRGIAAGLAAGGMTQSAIIGTAGDAINRLGLPADDVQRLQANVAFGYAVTYIFGSLGAILLCVNLLERFMGRTIREDAVAQERAASGGHRVFGRGDVAAAPDLVGRVYDVSGAAGRTVAALEEEAGLGVTIERLRRRNANANAIAGASGKRYVSSNAGDSGSIVPVTPAVTLQAGDCVLVVGRREAMVAAAARIGREIPHGERLNDVVLQTRRVVFTSTRANNIPFARLLELGKDVRMECTSWRSRAWAIR